tara:strand:- start:583 stop:942 length:360 start_codon:yes stop_codon:yes gene_type:complete
MAEQDSTSTVDQNIAAANALLGAPMYHDERPSAGDIRAVAHTLLAIAQMMAADRAAVIVVPAMRNGPDDGCLAELPGNCDVGGAYPALPWSMHYCTAEADHDGLHECGCGRVWGNRDDG